MSKGRGRVSPNPLRFMLPRIHKPDNLPSREYPYLLERRDPAGTVIHWISIFRPTTETKKTFGIFTTRRDRRFDPSSRFSSSRRRGSIGARLPADSFVNDFQETRESCPFGFLAKDGGDRWKIGLERETGVRGECGRAQVAQFVSAWMRF